MKLLLIGAIGLATSSLFGYYTIYAPKQEQARVIAAQVSQVQSDQQAQRDVAGLLSKVEEYRRRLAPEADTSWLVREVVAVGRTAGVDLAQISQLNPEEESGLTHLSINVLAQVSYHQLGRFIDALERAEPFIRVDRVDLSSARDGGEAAVQLGLSTYHLAPVVSPIAAAPAAGGAP